MQDRLFLAKVLREWREALGWTQEKAVGAVCPYLPESIDLKTYQRWERGEAQPHIKNYQALQQMLQEHGLWVIDFERNIDHDLLLMKICLRFHKTAQRCLRKQKEAGSECTDEMHFPLKGGFSPIKIHFHVKQCDGFQAWHIYKNRQHENGESSIIWERTTTIRD